jgi:hypothetical protein
MMTKVPASAWGTLPDNGASSIAAPSSRTRPESSTLASRLTALMSTYSLPGLSAARIPSGPSLRSFSALSSVTMLNVTSAAAATSRGVFIQTMPRSISGSALVAVRFVPHT